METQYLSIDKKMKIAYYSRYVDNSKIGVIIIHGLAEHKGRYKDFMEQLSNNNISAFAIDLRGHGESWGSRGDAKKFLDYLTDIHSFVCYIKEKYPKLKLAIFGHSFGGQIASAYVATYNTIDMLILSSPFLHIHPKAKLFKIIPYKLLGFIKLKKRHSESKEMLEYSKNDILACHYFSLRLLGIMFKEGIDYVWNRLENIKLPVLLLGGRLDPLINCENHPFILEKIESKDKTLKIYDKVKHRIVQNEYKDNIIEEIIAWINKHL